MKKSYILLTVLFMAALVSCQENEIRNDEIIAKDGDIVFRMLGNGKATKSMDPSTPVKGMAIDLGVENGTRLYLEETIVNLDDIDFDPQTKGTPAYTENLGVLYSDNLGVAAVGGNFGNLAYANAESEIGSDGKWLFKHHYDNDPWPKDEEEEVGFYLRMPANPAGVTIGENAYSDGAITFTYKTPTTAASTQDILFGYRSLAKKDYPKTGIPAVLYHALTGVKFAIGNEDDGIVITEVIFNGLYDEGKCVITPAEDGSTASANAVVWGDEDSPLTNSGTPISTESLLVDGAQQIADYDESDYEFPESFTSAGVTNNLNDNNATKTFWLIPQAFVGRTDVTLTIKYTFGSDGVKTALLTLGEILGERNVEWKAGELRTYTIRVAEVNVQIDDEVTMSEAFETSQDWKDAAGSTKEEVVITNTGNTPAFIRAAIVGQWIDNAGKPVFAFTDYVDGELVVEEVRSWYQDQFGSSKVSPRYDFGYFNELPGYDGPTGSTPYSGSYWVKGNDGFYYYTEAVDAGASTDEPLFDSYIMTSVPHITIGGKTYDVTFVLEVATQAISAIQSNGAAWDSYTDAWNNAANQ